MKTFSLGFILAFIASALFQHINITTVKEFFESMIVILPLMLLLIFICWQGIKSSYVYFTYKKRFCLLNSNNNWECLLIDGVWGSGKTTHYKKYYQYIDDNPNIYISCFSASRSELIAQIIQQQFWCKLLTLNGLLAKIMESNWQIFMPKNRVVVFDDLERLHASQDNYLDLIGIIDHLKLENKCKIILICNMSELKEPIFNTYMERIVDKTGFPKLMSENEFTNYLIKGDDELTKIMLSKLYNNYVSDKISNLRIIKNIMPMITDQLNRDYSSFNEIEQVLNGSFHEIEKLMSKHYLFYSDNNLFKDSLKFSNLKKDSSPDGERKEEREKIEGLLSKYDLRLADFRYGNYNNFRDIDEVFKLQLSDFLKSEIEGIVNAEDVILVEQKISEYLDKFISQQTSNKFNLDYVLYLLFIICTAKVGKCDELLESVLGNVALMNQVTFEPVRNAFKRERLLFPLFNEREFELINAGRGIDGCVLMFEQLYRSFYRNKVINKFIESTNKVLWDEVDLFARGWFICDHIKEDKNIQSEHGIDSNDVAKLNANSNKYLNLGIIQKWLDNKVEQNTLIEYYVKVLDAFDENLRGDGKVKFLDWLLSQQIESFSKVAEKFAIIREKFTKLDKMINAYVNKNSPATQKYNTLIEKYSDLIEKLKLPESV